MRPHRHGHGLLRPLWTRLPRWFAVELEDPVHGPVQVGPSWVLEAEAIRELVAGTVSDDLPRPTRPAYEVAHDGPSGWRYLIVYRTRPGTWLVARTDSPELAARIADHLNRALAEPEPDDDSSVPA